LRRKEDRSPCSSGTKERLALLIHSEREGGVRSTWKKHDAHFRRGKRRALQLGKEKIVSWPQEYEVRKDGRSLRKEEQDYPEKKKGRRGFFLSLTAVKAESRRHAERGKKSVRLPRKEKVASFHLRKNVIIGEQRIPPERETSPPEKRSPNSLQSSGNRGSQEEEGGSSTGG